MRIQLNDIKEKYSTMTSAQMTSFCTCASSQNIIMIMAPRQKLDNTFWRAIILREIVHNCYNLAKTMLFWDHLLHVVLNWVPVMHTRVSVVWHMSLPVVNNFNKTQATVFPQQNFVFDNFLILSGKFNFCRTTLSIVVKSKAQLKTSAPIYSIHVICFHKITLQLKA